MCLSSQFKDGKTAQINFFHVKQSCSLFMTTLLLYFCGLDRAQTVWEQPKTERGERWEREDGEEYNEVA